MKFPVRIGQATGVLLLLAVFATCGGEAFATLLPINGTLSPAPSAVDLGGGTILGTENVGFTGTTYSGSITSTVEKNDASNPFGVNDLTFIYQVQNNGSSSGTITHLSLNGFGNLQVDASYVTAGGQVYPADFTRSSGATNGNTVGAFWLNANGTTPLNPSNVSTEIVLHTNATTFINGTAAVIGGSITNPAAYIPVPEPSSIVLALAGLGSIVTLGWRRNRNRRLG